MFDVGKDYGRGNSEQGGLGVQGVVYGSGSTRRCIGFREYNELYMVQGVQGGVYGSRSTRSCIWFIEFKELYMVQGVQGVV